MTIGSPEALRHLRRDPVLKRVIRQVGPCTLVPARRQPYEALVRAIAHQQVHGRAAEAILGRFIACCCPRGLSRRPRRCWRPRPRQMRACGLSANKVLAIRDIAEKAAAGHRAHARAGAPPVRRRAGRTPGAAARRRAAGRSRCC